MADSTGEPPIENPTPVPVQEGTPALATSAIPEGADLKLATNGRPLPGTEVFLGNLPRDVTEDMIRPCYAGFGDIYEVRVIRDKNTQQPRGFGFVTFYNKADAVKAVAETVDKLEIGGNRIRVSISTPKNRLFIGNLPRTLTRDELVAGLQQLTVGLTRLDFLHQADDPSKNRGFAFAEYDSNSSAEAARRALNSPNVAFGGRPPTVSWAETSDTPADPDILARVKNVYVSNIAPGFNTEAQMSELFSPFGEIEKITAFPQDPSQPGARVRDYAFVIYKEREDALSAIEALNGREFGGRPLSVALAKPMAPRNRSNNNRFPGGGGGGFDQRGGGGRDRGYPGGRGDGGWGNYRAGGGGGRYPNNTPMGMGPGLSVVSPANVMPGSMVAPSVHGMMGGGGAPSGGINGAPGGATLVPVMLPNRQVGYMYAQPGQAVNGQGGQPVQAVQGVQAPQGVQGVQGGYIVQGGAGAGAGAGAAGAVYPDPSSGAAVAGQFYQNQGGMNNNGAGRGGGNGAGANRYQPY